MNTVATTSSFASTEMVVEEKTENAESGDIFDLYSKNYEHRRRQEMSLNEFLEGCRDDASFYASASERMVAAIGEPELIDTSTDPRLGSRPSRGDRASECAPEVPRRPHRTRPSHRSERGRRRSRAAR